MFLNGNKETFSFGTKDEKYTEFWNVSGELLAAMHVMEYALTHGISECSLYYDYMGIEMWATKKWKRNNVLTNRILQHFVNVYFHMCEYTFTRYMLILVIHIMKWLTQLAKAGCSDR